MQKKAVKIINPWLQSQGYFFISARNLRNNSEGKPWAEITPPLDCLAGLPDIGSHERKS